MSPFARLPLDIINIIFRHCIPTDHNPYICSAEPPLLLTHVSRRWREVAHGTPMLWANIHIHIPFYPEAPTCTRYVPGLGLQYTDLGDTSVDKEARRAYLQNVNYWETKMRDLKDMAAVWLSRAKNCPISLSLSQFSDIRDTTKGHDKINAVLDVLLGRCAQWKSVELYASSPVIAQFLAVPTHAASDLQRISIKWQTPMERNPGQSAAAANRVASLVSPHGLMTAPELKSLSLQILPRNIMSLPVRWEGLTELIFDEYFSDSRVRFLPPDALDLLALCPRLVRCRLAIGRGRIYGSSASDIPTDVVAPTRKVVSLPCLEHLAIDEGVPLGDFFQRLHLPSLKEVVFSTALPAAEYGGPPPPSHLSHPAAPAPSQQSGTSPPLSSSNSSSPVPGAHNISPDTPPRRAFGSPLVTLLSQCGRGMERLTFDQAGLSPRDIEQALELVPNLTHLTMNRKSLSRCSAAAFLMGADHAKPGSGYLSPALLERLTPIAEDLAPGNQNEDADRWDAAPGRSTMTTTPASCLCPRLVSFSCKLAATSATENALIAFLQNRRRTNTTTTTHELLQKCTISFSLPSGDSAPLSEGDRAVKDVVSELVGAGTDMSEFDLAVIYPTPHILFLPDPLPPLPTGEVSEPNAPSSPPVNSAPTVTMGRTGAAYMMSLFVPPSRDLCAGMYGYGSWYAAGGPGELQDSWFEAMW